MEFFHSMDVSVPVSQIVMLVIISTFSLLYGRVKLALLVNYIFTVYWGYFLNRDFLENYTDMPETFCIIYFGFGIGIIMLAMLGFLSQKSG